ncbi:MAG: hypothetical protein ACYDAO_07075 [Thermoplasmataceae archaeon]
MSKILETTRSNLYQTVSELTLLGILEIAEIKSEKNYIEKYYQINEAMFKNLSPEGWRSETGDIDTEDLRDIIASFLLTQSLILRLLAEEINLASDEQMSRYKEMFQENMFMLGYSKSSDVTYKRLVKFMNGMDEFFNSTEDNESGQTSENTFLLVGFPSLSLKK